MIELVVNTPKVALTTTTGIKEYNRGKEEGYNAGYSSGYDNGHADGYTQGEIDGNNTGYENGYGDGKQEGYDIGYDEGHSSGYTDGEIEGFEKGYVVGESDGFNIGYNEGFADGEFSKVEFHRITIASDLTDGYNLILTNNDFIKQHCEKDGFMAQLISLQTHKNCVAIGYAFHLNRGFLAVDNSTYYGGNVSVNGNNSLLIRTAANNCLTTTYNGVPYVKTNGDMYIQNNASNATLKAGDYLIILSIAEV